jgi:hypothetical protein
LGNVNSPTCVIAWHTSVAFLLAVFTSRRHEGVGSGMPAVASLSPDVQ